MKNDIKQYRKLIIATLYLPSQAVVTVLLLRLPLVAQPISSSLAAHVATYRAQPPASPTLTLQGSATRNHPTARRGTQVGMLARAWSNLVTCSWGWGGIQQRGCTRRGQRSGERTGKVPHDGGAAPYVWLLRWGELEEVVVRAVLLMETWGGGYEDEEWVDKNEERSRYRFARSKGKDRGLASDIFNPAGRQNLSITVFLF